MYTSPKFHQIAFTDFNQSCGMQLDPKNEWVLLADRLDWCRMEEKTRYNELFPSKTGHPAKPFRMALGSLIIQKRKKLSDRGLVKEIGENPLSPALHWVRIVPEGLSFHGSPPGVVPEKAWDRGPDDGQRHLPLCRCGDEGT